MYCVAKCDSKMNICDNNMYVLLFYVSLIPADHISDIRNIMNLLPERK